MVKLHFCTCQKKRDKYLQNKISLTCICGDFFVLFCLTVQKWIEDKADFLPRINIERPDTVTEVCTTAL